MSAGSRFVLSAWLCCLIGCAHLTRGVTHPLPSAVVHPLDPLLASEIESAFSVVRARFQSDPALPHERLYFPLLALAEPEKQQVLAWQPGRSFSRHAEVQVLHAPSNRLWTVDVDLQRREVSALVQAPRGTQPALTAQDFAAGDAAVRAHEPWRQAMRARGVDPELAYLDGWAAGDVALPEPLAAKLPFGHDTRLMRYLTFARGTQPGAHERAQNPYDRPVEGVVVTVDLNTQQVIALADTGVRPVSSESGYAERTAPLRRLHTREPDGSDLHIQGHFVRWHGFQFHVAMHPREGLVLYDVRFDDHGELRRIAYRLALSEIYVPYGLGDDAWLWRGAFDVGEFSAGKLAQTLERGRDVPDNAQLLPTLLFADAGPSAQNPTGSLTIPDSIALYERDNGVLFSRTDPSTSARDTVPGRELVTSWSCWIGNYIYSFDWVFKLDGSIEVKVQLTGTTLNRGATAAPEPSAPKVGKDARGVLVAAPNHQHFLNFRLDLDVDGEANAAMEMEAQHLPLAEFKNAFDATMLRLDEETARDVEPSRARHWHIESATRQNQFGKPTSYALEPAAFAVPYAAPDFAGLERAQFALHQLWLTRYRSEERYAAGTFPNQAKVHDGLGVYSTPAESLRGQDLVLWYTTGFTHLAKPEDHPVMSAESIGFRLAPRGFFARNPALELTPKD